MHLDRDAAGQSRDRARSRSSGFTLVEFVVTIILLGILATVALSRILRADTFNAFIVSDQIISLSRAAQQAALGRSDVLLTITPNVALDSVNLTTASDGGATTIDSVDLDLGSVTLTGDVNDTSSCATPPVTAITNGTPLIIRFGELGDLEPSGFGAGTAISSAVRICLNDSPVDSVCVSPSGFAYTGDCDV
jgi:prepilin-type N-terminal cleavage/methylation domain-containing protein